MTANRQFMQLQADTFNKKVFVSELDTCWGVAKGVLVSKNIEVDEVKEKGETFLPNPERHKEIVLRYNRWNEERSRVYGWKGE